MEPIKIFVTRLPKTSNECPFCQMEYDYDGFAIGRYCMFHHFSCRLDHEEPCDMLERGMKINDMRF